MSKLVRVRRQLLQEGNAEPTLEQIAAEMGITPQRVGEVLKMSQEPLSLDSPIGEGEDSPWSDFIADEKASVPLEAVTQTICREELVGVLGLLTRRERDILELRFGLRDDRPHTLQEVGRTFGITRERIRQIEAKALAKLSMYREVRALRSYLGS